MYDSTFALHNADICETLLWCARRWQLYVLEVSNCQMQIKQLIEEPLQKNWKCVTGDHPDVYVLCVCSTIFTFETIFTLVTQPSQNKLVFGSVLLERELICYVASVTGFAPSDPRFPAHFFSLYMYKCYQHIHICAVNKYTQKSHAW